VFEEGSDNWAVEELSLEDFEGYQTWIDFRVLTPNGGGKGVMLDDIMVLVTSTEIISILQV
jgi:hypothetical protein